MILPILAVTFATFCVWLTVRMVNRRERWAKWALAAALMFGVLMAVLNHATEPPAFIYGSPF